MNTADIRKLFEDFGAPIAQDDVWQVQSATVIKHKALERLAAAAKIEFERPQVLRAERDEAVILVSGKLGERSEWSVGEALVNVNYRVTGKMAAYVYAMAEKRAKDRVILKLAGLHGLYSEDEADEFKESSSAPQQGRNAAPASSPSAPPRQAGAANLSELGETFRKAMELAATKDDLGGWMSANAETMKRELGEQEASVIRQLAAARYRDLPDGSQEAAE
jgi:hypothetical protein